MTKSYNKRFDAKSDDNSLELLQFIRTIPGISIIRNQSSEKGCPDWIIGLCGITWLAEIKGEKGKLSKEQDLFFKTWSGGKPSIYRTEQDILIDLKKRFNKDFKK